MHVADECFETLHRAGWSVGEVHLHATDGALIWQVDGANGANALLVQAPTQAEAWLRACETAQVAGMLGPSDRS